LAKPSMLNLAYCSSVYPIPHLVIHSIMCFHSSVEYSAR
jgi:hypothetical protein